MPTSFGPDLPMGVTEAEKFAIQNPVVGMWIVVQETGMVFRYQEIGRVFVGTWKALTGDYLDDWQDKLNARYECNKCCEDGLPPHTCPMKSEVDRNRILCLCCEKCSTECRDDI